MRSWKLFVTPVVAGLAFRLLSPIAFVLGVAFAMLWLPVVYSTLGYRIDRMPGREPLS